MATRRPVSLPEPADHSQCGKCAMAKSGTTKTRAETAAIKTGKTKAGETKIKSYGRLLKSTVISVRPPGDPAGPIRSVRVRSDRRWRSSDCVFTRPGSKVVIER